MSHVHLEIDSEYTSFKTVEMLNLYPWIKYDGKAYFLIYREHELTTCRRYIRVRKVPITVFDENENDEDVLGANHLIHILSPNESSYRFLCEFNCHYFSLDMQSEPIVIENEITLHFDDELFISQQSTDDDIFYHEVSKRFDILKYSKKESE